MTAVYPKPLRRLVALLSRLPGIGEKTATRLSMFLLKMPPEFVRELGAAIAGIPESVTKCSKCYNIADEDPCSFCLDPARRDDQICVVEGPTDIVTIEKSGRASPEVRRRGTKFSSWPFWNPGWPFWTRRIRA